MYFRLVGIGSVPIHADDRRRLNTIPPPSPSSPATTRRWRRSKFGGPSTYSTIVKTIPRPTDEKRKKFAKYQEGARKDIERAFGVLQKNDKSLNIQYVRLHQRGYDTLCTLVSSFIT
ncbi:putative harbinger transposase-derived protein [Helianthus annuus]|nr:putative harbinger transposase-derived protein [Helianthus annuus]KAJ0583885.1 putative harbinger transposase-derived protein [Helianthus annuus]